MTDKTPDDDGKHRIKDFLEKHAISPTVFQDLALRERIYAVLRETEVISHENINALIQEARRALQSIHACTKQYAEAFTPGDRVNTRRGSGTVQSINQINGRWTVAVTLESIGRAGPFVPRSVTKIDQVVPAIESIDSGTYELVAGVKGDDWDNVDPYEDLKAAIAQNDPATFAVIRLKNNDFYQLGTDGVGTVFGTFSDGSSGELEVVDLDYAQSLLGVSKPLDVLKKYGCSPITSAHGKVKKVGKPNVYVKSHIDLLPKARERRAEKQSAYDYKLLPDETISFRKKNSDDSSDQEYEGMTPAAFARRNGLDPVLHSMVVHAAQNGGGIRPITEKLNIVTASLEKANVYWDDDMMQMIHGQIGANGRAKLFFDTGQEGEEQFELRPAMQMTKFMSECDYQQKSRLNDVISKKRILPIENLQVASIDYGSNKIRMTHVFWEHELRAAAGMSDEAGLPAGRQG